MLARRRAGLGASLAALAAASLVSSAGRAAETLDGVVAEGGCAQLAFLMTPGGSHAVAARHLETAPGPLQTVTTMQDGRVVAQLARPTESLGVAIVSWDLAASRTSRFEVDEVDAPSPRQTKVDTWLVALDEQVFAVSGGAGGDYLLVDVDGGRIDRATAAFPEVLSTGLLSSGFAVDRRGPWIARTRVLLEPSDDTLVRRAAPANSDERRVAAINILTGETRELRYDWPDPAPINFDDPWRLDRDGRVGLRVLRDGETLALQLPLDPQGAGWRTLLTYDAIETFEPYPPDDFGPDTESMIVVSDIGRSGPAAGRLDLETGAITYFNEARSRGLFLDVELSPRQDALLWETRRGQSATGSGPITVGVSLAGAAAAPGDSARGFDMTFGSAEAEALYDALREGWGHVDVLDWVDDGSAAIVELWGPGERRRVEAVSIVDGSTVTARTELCDTTRPSRFPELEPSSRRAGTPP